VLVGDVWLWSGQSNVSISAGHYAREPDVKADLAAARLPRCVILHNGMIAPLAGHPIRMGRRPAGRSSARSTRMAALAMEWQSWEQGILAQAALEAGRPEPGNPAAFCSRSRP